jgi:hypothetical protein
MKHLLWQEPVHFVTLTAEDDGAVATLAFLFK